MRAYIIEYDTLPAPAIVPRGGKVESAWPTNSATFILQSATNLIALVVWSAVSPGPVVVNGKKSRFIHHPCLRRIHSFALDMNWLPCKTSACARRERLF